MIANNTSVIQIFGSLMKKPNLLSEVDKYQLSKDDFATRFEKNLFAAISNLYAQGVERINPIDVENFLNVNKTALDTFTKNNGIEYLQDAEAMSDINSFEYYYARLKKVNLLNELTAQGIDISEYYIDDLTNPKAYEINSNFELLTITDILEGLKRKLVTIEKKYDNNDVTETQDIFENIEEILTDAQTQTDVGWPVQGKIYNEVIAGARLGTLSVRSAGSGTGKTRNSVGDACYLAFPIRYNWEANRWERIGSGERVLVIATEQNFKEIRKMVLAYVTGINESKFRYGNFSEVENKIVAQAIELIKMFRGNFNIVRMPNPTIQLVKSIIRENVLLKNIHFVFYDYIFVGPSLLNEFKGFNLRNDEILLMFSTALKDLAVELNISVTTSTQLNAKGDDNSEIKNESSISGSRSIINKADFGCIMSRPTKDELEILKDKIDSLGCLPNLVTDIYKVRSGEWTQLRIWSFIDLGTLRKVDYFVTDSRLQVVEGFNYTYDYDIHSIKEEEEYYKSILHNLNND